MCKKQKYHETTLLKGNERTKSVDLLTPLFPEDIVKIIEYTAKFTYDKMFYQIAGTLLYTFSWNINF